MEIAKSWYDGVSKGYLLGLALLFPAYFSINAPFGRFSPLNPSMLLVDGIKSWFIMEIVAPLCFLGTFLSSPLTRPLSSLQNVPYSPPPMFMDVIFSSLNIRVPNPPTFLGLIFLSHYVNRAMISPIRTPVRSKTHIIVTFSGITFNVINASLMGSFFSALAASSVQLSSVAANRTFWIGIGMWALGAAGNIWHDEILYSIRRQTKPIVSKNVKENQQDDTKPLYAIPHGGLYPFISYPNYFSEWIEWLGYAIAASALTTHLPSNHVVYPFAEGASSLGPLSKLQFIQQLTPPWIFVIVEVFVMLPRAWNGHKWYHKTFPNYPRERKVVVPFLL